MHISNTLFDDNKELEHKLCITYMCRLQVWEKDVTDRLVDIIVWLEEHIDKDNFSFGFRDYGQHGEYMLYTRSKEDLLAFKLRWAGV